MDHKGSQILELVAVADLELVAGVVGVAGAVAGAVAVPDADADEIFVVEEEGVEKVFAFQFHSVSDYWNLGKSAYIMQRGHFYFVVDFGEFPEEYLVFLEEAEEVRWVAQQVWAVVEVQVGRLFLVVQFLGFVLQI